ncbi:hypothetical protein [Paraburkholderia sediminicola]|uniref:hypothetical protein n=1 Tax=Paraburkholderia sediminicola TaxID=458836 RepID=UPI0038BB6B0D
MPFLENTVRVARTTIVRLLSRRRGSLELWRGLQYGMSFSDVRRRMPSAYIPTSATKIQLPNVGDAIEFLRIDNVISMAHDFTGRLYFRCDRLQQVTLSHHHEASNVFSMEAFDSLSAKLRRAYGPESGHESKSSLALDIDVLIWTQGPVAIALVMLRTKAGKHTFALSLNFTCSGKIAELDGRPSVLTNASERTSRRPSSFDGPATIRSACMS